MALYYVNNNAQPNGDHEVHVSGCTFMPSNKTPLGDHPNCQSAVAQAKRIHAQSNGCAFCSRPCHTT
jgi:hypothetical protein